MKINQQFKSKDNEDEENVLICGPFFENGISSKWLSCSEAANFLRVSENALRIMVHRGQIPVFKLGRRLRFRLADCQALFAKKGA